MVAFHMLIVMLHSNFRINVIGTQKSVYWGSGLGNLDRTQNSEFVSLIPLQDRFYSDSQRGFPIAIHNQTTLAFIQSIVSRMMPVIQCTAFMAPFRSVISINFIKRYLKHLAIRFKKFLELSIRNSIDFSISFLVKISSFASKILQFLNRNVSIIKFGKTNDFFSNLATSSFDKIKLFMFKPFKMLFRSMRTFISKTQKSCSFFQISSLPYCNITTKIKLFNNLRSFNVKNSSRSKSRRSYINTNNISLVDFLFLEFLFKNNRNSTIFQNRNVVKYPSILKKRIKSLKLFIGSYRNNKVFLRSICNFEARVSSFGLNKSKPSLVKANRTVIDFKAIVKSITFYVFSTFPNVFSCFLNYITWQERGLSYV